MVYWVYGLFFFYLLMNLAPYHLFLARVAAFFPLHLSFHPLPQGFSVLELEKIRIHIKWVELKRVFFLTVG